MGLMGDDYRTGWAGIGTGKLKNGLGRSEGFFCLRDLDFVELWCRETAVFYHRV